MTEFKIILKIIIVTVKLFRTVAILDMHTTQQTAWANSRSTPAEPCSTRKQCVTVTRYVGWLQWQPLHALTQF